MRIVVTGGTGLVGSALRRALEGRGDEVQIASRRGGDGRIPFRAVAEEKERGFTPRDALSGVDAVVHLAGESVGSGRWTAARKAAIEDSRVLGTRAVVEALEHAQPRPRVLVSASAVGYYGDCSDRELPEDAPAGDDYLAAVSRRWEAEAVRAEALGVRVVLLRFGLVLSADGGALPRMLPPFKLGVGGRLGSGHQAMAWVHIDDVVRVATLAIDAADLDGPVNVVAPGIVDNRGFTRALGKALGRPTFTPVPRFAISAMFGEMGRALLLAGQRAVPRRLQRAGFEFRFPEIDAALRDVLSS